MAQTRWVQEPVDAAGDDGGHQTPADHVTRGVVPDAPGLIESVVPPPLVPADDALVHLRFTDIDLEFGSFRWQEHVGCLGVDVTYDGLRGEYPLLIPIDLEKAVAISRERHGEPKKYETHRFWFKFMPAVSGRGFDGDVLLVQVDQTRTPVSVEPVDAPHFDGYAAVLIQLRVVGTRVLRDAIEDAWLACAPPALAEEFLATKSR